ncbi:MAG: hypothetical protein CO030_03470 [Candidatus Magasanikbacteria bacterium CG_4_9_14_0_2_um_filter_42_11]|uniref:DUF192 domain-containing protein n=1 Tax=Candidatus Magasanikbacteria bacterium CG_4_9_14_0_2_um_filter_42_11 TaxID=1974643 RepID=A0A2M8F9H1_9BACT|nr:MAG: hypothetical protein COU34_02770 [Candidatus Magasanikbacteria bacterium CG10_big_fil_rev_8_21_14_0_10_43_9]PIY92884.1 MAG: hypothetical protein COY70_00870 [Candidatus Magasanikbacteria bacterium CG_4_10_14_0_8_um_filter_42_12]PJC52319.1 MAG: hypothetical protein CO030_03470 [Candidatus Magasanikbacteria bacterium CG_4_9_14_0_2_um_filter_42_11]
MAKKHIIFGKKSMFLLGVFFLCFVFLFFWNMRPPSTRDIVLGEQTLHVYVAETIKDMYVGLGGREDLDGKDGMLFLYDYPGRHGIVMRDMLFPIDILWFSEGQLVDIAPAVPVEPQASEYELTSYRPRTDATMVLELPAGWAAAHDLKIGDMLFIPL